MTKHQALSTVLALALAAAAALAAHPVLAQDAPQREASPDQPSETAGDYVPPLRGAPAKTVGGASRGTIRPAAPLPIIELLAPADHAGQTASAAPTLLYFVSRPVAWPMQLTVSAPLRVDPVLEVTIPSAPAPGIYPLRLADYRARLEPGIAYTWSVSIILNPRAWSRNIVASAVVLRDPANPAAALAAMAGPRGAATLARAGLWYDAVAAAYDNRAADGGAQLGRLISQAGLKETARFERAAAVSLR